MCADDAVELKLPVTPARVEERLRKAVALQAALKTERFVAEIVAGRYPENGTIKGSIGSEGIGCELPGDGDEGLVTHTAEALAWLRWLEPDDAALVRARLADAPWKSICWRFGISRATADRRYRYALGIIAWRLNAHTACLPTPSLRAMLKLRAA